MKTKSLLTVVVFLIVALSSVAQETGTFTDARDGKTYKTVKIGTQTWMAENLAYKASSGCWAYDNDDAKVTTYGYLYNWETAKTVCPSGWHLPSDIEWKTLIDYLGGDSIAGGKLKESGSTHWYNNTNATNESGFTGLPGGFCNSNGEFKFSQFGGYWWSSTERYSNDFFFRSFGFNSSKILSSSFNKSFKIAVRCVKDNLISKPTTQTETNNIKVEDKTIVIKGTLFSSDKWSETMEAYYKNPHKENFKVAFGLNWVTITKGYNEQKYKVSSSNTYPGRIVILVDGAVKGLANTIEISASDNGYSYDISMDNVDGFYVSNATMKEIDIIEETVKEKVNDKYPFLDVAIRDAMQLKYNDIERGWYGLQNKEYYKVSVGKKFGLTNTLGVEIIPPIYDAIENAPDFLAKVKANGKYGIIDASGNVALEIKYDEIGSFHYGSAGVIINNEGMLIDLSGKEVINPVKLKNYFIYNSTTICDLIYKKDFAKVKVYAKYVDLNVLQKKQAGYYFPVELLLDKIENAKFDKDYDLITRKEVFEIIQLFLKQGMNVDLDISHTLGTNIDLIEKGFSGTTMLVSVIDFENSERLNFMNGDRLKMVQLLIENKANVNSITSNSYTAPLYKLCCSGRLDEDVVIAQLLIDNGADISIDGDKGQILIKKAKESDATKELIEVLEKAKKGYVKK